ncbi:MAG TPA: heavy metal translocating P-type ATPase [Euzebyales bacterium]
MTASLVAAPHASAARHAVDHLGAPGITQFRVTLLAVAAGGVLALTGTNDAAEVVWAVVTAVTAAGLAVAIVRDLLQRRAGVDVIALMAMVGALALGQHLAGAVIALMLTGGQALEAFAAGRARHELTALLAGAPRTARRIVGARLERVDVDAVVPGDALLVRSGEAVPVDAVVTGPVGMFDESALTGETRPVARHNHARVASGAVNAGAPVTLRAVASARDSTYAGIVHLVRHAAEARTPFTRMADRYAIAFVPVTIAIAAGAWVASGDPVRALAVLVVATPCPLILAVPIALVSGVSVAARRGLIVKGAAPLEQLAVASSVVFDKTGTLTAGAPHVADIVTVPHVTPDELLRLAASVEQASAHVFADAIIDAARVRGLPLAFPDDVEERHGGGIAARVDGCRVRLGSAAWIADGGQLPEPVRSAHRRARLEGASAVVVGVDGDVAGVLLLDDPLRPESGGVVRRLRAAGVSHIAMLTGDDRSVAESVAAALALDDVWSDQTPGDKVDLVREWSDRDDRVTVMVGDGVNDAPALAGADVGIAMGARGAAASSEAADVVITVDRLDRLTEGITIARWTRRIAVQSVVAGMGLSLVAMVFAAAGGITVLAGAVLQEAIDVAVILNALRALRVPGEVRVTQADRQASSRFRTQHRTLVAGFDRVKEVADRLEWSSDADAVAEIGEIRQFLVATLLPHEHAEEEQLYPRLATVLADGDPTGPLISTHREIERLVARFERLAAYVPENGPAVGDRLELRRLLYGLHAILRLHVAQEEELYLRLDDAAVATAGAVTRQP